MSQILKKYILIFFFFLLSNCGFKVLDNSKINNFSIKEIQTSGNKRINFKIKNNLLVNSSKSNEYNLIININTKKIKSIKEKNIKNEITKYEISLNTTVKCNLIASGEDFEFNFSATGDYLVGDNYSDTIANEKKLIDNLVEDISDQVLIKIRSKLNDI